MSLVQIPILLLLIILNLVFIILPMVYAFLHLSRFLQYRTGKTQKQLISNDELVLDSPFERETTEFVGYPRHRYPEILFLLLAPIGGILMIWTMGDKVAAFKYDYNLSVTAYTLLTFVGYWLSKNFRASNALSKTVIMNYILIIGVILCLFMTLHYYISEVILFSFVLPFFGVPVLSPLPAIIFLSIEIYKNNKHLNQALENKIIPKKQERFIAHFRWTYSPQNFIMLLGIISIVQFLLMLFGQPIDGIIRAFTEGKDFFFSNGGILDLF